MFKKVCVAMLFLAAIVSCDKKAVLDFSAEFQQAVEAKDFAHIQRLYPAVTKDNVLSFSFDEKEMVINKEDEILHVDFSPELSMDLQKDKDQIRVLNSKGLFVFHPDSLAIAKRFGQYNPDLNDVQNAVRMKDYAHWTYLNLVFFPEEIYPLSIGEFTIVHSPNYGADSGFGYLEVENRSGVMVNGSDYTLNYTAVGIYYGKIYRQQKSEPGRDVSANAKTEFPLWFSDHDSFDNLHIDYNLSHVEMLDKYFVEDVSGEYDEFAEEYGSVMGDREADSPAGRFEISGTIGKSKASGYLIFDENSGEICGEYGYGRSSTGLMVKGLVRSENRFTLVEKNAKGAITGLFIGGIRDNSMEGTFISSNSKYSEFSMTMTQAADPAKK